MKTTKISAGNSIRVGARAAQVVPDGTLINLSAKCPVDVKDLKHEVRCTTDIHRLIESVACKLDIQVGNCISKILAIVSAVMADDVSEKRIAAPSDFSLWLDDRIIKFSLSFDISGAFVVLE